MPFYLDNLPLRPFLVHVLSRSLMIQEASEYATTEDQYFEIL